MTEREEEEEGEKEEGRDRARHRAIEREREREKFFSIYNEITTKSKKEKNAAIRQDS